MLTCAADDSLHIVSCPCPCFVTLEGGEVVKVYDDPRHRQAVHDALHESSRFLPDVLGGEGSEAAYREAALNSELVETAARIVGFG